MKKLILSTMIIAASLTGSAQTGTQCKAVTKAHGKQCLRKATKDGYCTQHYKMVQDGRNVKTI